jgi:hypothetical protein
VLLWNTLCATAFCCHQQWGDATFGLRILIVCCQVSKLETRLNADCQLLRTVTTPPAAGLLLCAVVTCSTWAPHCAAEAVGLYLDPWYVSAASRDAFRDAAAAHQQ